jgi:esterase/lipase superfamily enzyme
MHGEYGSWYSPSLDRWMEYLWYGHWGPPLLVFPTSKGRYYENYDQGLISSLADKIDGGALQVICVDSVDGESWYNYGAHPGYRAWRHTQYDNYLRWELVPYALHRAGQSRIQVFGASFGAYHAANFTTRHPDVVSNCICFSGVYDIHSFVQGYWDDNCYYNCPTASIYNMGWDWCRRLDAVRWVICTGEYDHLVEENRYFARLLSAKGIGNHSEFWWGVFGHDWPWWKSNLRRFV